MEQENLLQRIMHPIMEVPEQKAIAISVMVMNTHIPIRHVVFVREMDT